MSEVLTQRRKADTEKAENYMETENKLATTIIAAAIKVHSALGPGLLESAYKECLFYELLKTGLYLEKEKPLPLIYEEIKMDCRYRLDILETNSRNKSNRRTG